MCAVQATAPDRLNYKFPSQLITAVIRADHILHVTSSYWSAYARGSLWLVAAETIVLEMNFGRVVSAIQTMDNEMTKLIV